MDAFSPLPVYSPPVPPDGRLAAPEIARLSGLDRREVNKWCRENPGLAVRWDGQWWIAPGDFEAFREQRREARRQAEQRREAAQEAVREAARQRAGLRHAGQRQTAAQRAEQRAAERRESAAMRVSHLTTAQAVARAGASQPAVCRWARITPGLAVWQKNRWWFVPEALDAFLAARRGGGHAGA